MTAVNVRFQMKKDTTAGWTAANPTLLVGEPGFDTDQNILKIGDGVTQWTLLKTILSNSVNINIRDFGAVGNGTTDDKAAIHRALDVAVAMAAATGGATVVMPAGRYIYGVDGLVVPDKVQLVQEYGAQLLYPGGATYNRIRFNGVHNTTETAQMVGASQGNRRFETFSDGLPNHNNHAIVYAASGQRVLNGATVFYPGDTLSTIAGGPGTHTLEGIVLKSDNMSLSKNKVDVVVTTVNASPTDTIVLTHATSYARFLSTTNNLVTSQPVTFNSTLGGAVVVGETYYIRNPAGDSLGGDVITASPPGTTTVSLWTRPIGCFGNTKVTFPMALSNQSLTGRIYVADGMGSVLMVEDTISNTSNGGTSADKATPGYTGGTRNVLSGSFYQTAPTNLASVSGGYVGVLGVAGTKTGDGGTGLTVSTARGAYFGGNFVTNAEATATNVYNVCGIEVNVGSFANSAQTLYMSGVAAVGAINSQAAGSTSAFSVGGLDVHTGWKHGLQFTDLNGRAPMTTDGVLIGSYFPNTGTAYNATKVTNGRYNVATGIDFTQFNFSDSLLKSTNFLLNDASNFMRIGPASGGTSVRIQNTSGNTTILQTGSVDANLDMRNYGTGGTRLLDSGGQPRIFVNTNGAYVTTSTLAGGGTTTNLALFGGLGTSTLYSVQNTGGTTTSIPRLRVQNSIGVAIAPVSVVNSVSQKATMATGELSFALDTTTPSAPVIVFIYKNDAGSNFEARVTMTSTT